MIYEHVVELAVKYLETTFAAGKFADLPGMLMYVDAYDHILMERDEVNEVLKRCPSVAVQRADGRIVFTQSAGDHEIYEEDMHRNVAMYREDFAAMARRLEGRSRTD